MHIGTVLKSTMLLSQCVWHGYYSIGVGDTFWEFIQWMNFIEKEFNSIFNLVLNYVLIRQLFVIIQLKNIQFQKLCLFNFKQIYSKYQKIIQGLHLLHCRIWNTFWDTTYPDQGSFQSKLNPHIDFFWSLLNLGSVGWTLSTIPFQFN